MNLYLLSQTVNNDYETFDSCVVCANNEYEARMIHPSHTDKEPVEYNETVKRWIHNIIGYNGKLLHFDVTDTWSDLKDIEVKLIGKANKSIKKGVICASFNAG